MLPRLPAVEQHIRIGAPGFIERIREDRQSAESAGFVDGRCDGDGGRRELIGSHVRLNPNQSYSILQPEELIQLSLRQRPRNPVPISSTL